MIKRKLGVNIDHIATIRNARGEIYPDPLRAALIAEKSGTQVVNIKNQNELKNFFKKNLFNDEMVICMGAGSISNWIREIGMRLQWH